jgi:hypothetical protein
MCGFCPVGDPGSFGGGSSWGIYVDSIPITELNRAVHCVVAKGVLWLNLPLSPRVDKASRQ